MILLRLSTIIFLAFLTLALLLLPLLHYVVLPLLLHQNSTPHTLYHQTPYSQTPMYHRITVLTSSPALPHTPFLTCLRLPEPFTRYPTTGSSLPLPLPLSTQARNMTLVVLPPHSSEGWHNPPVPMFFVLLRGKAVVYTYKPHDRSNESTYEGTKGELVAESYLPSTETNGPQSQKSIVEQTKPEPQEVSISVGSPNQILLALDIQGRGHWTDYPSGEETWALQVPLAEGWEETIAEWDVVGEGGCD